MSFSWWTFWLQAANFLILVWLLQRFLFKPVKAIVARRKEEIARTLTEASAEKERAAQLKQELEAARLGIGVERQKMIDEQRALLSAEHEKIIEDARHEVETVHSQALRRLDEERTSASDQLYEQTIVLVAKLAEHLLREIAGTTNEQAFLERVTGYLDRMPTEDRAKLLPNNGAKDIFVTTAHTLDAHEQSDWREELAKRLRTDLSVTFQTDSALIAGAVLTFPHAILNFNWRDTLALALKELHDVGHPR
jgi:F-type H+-transporting ATPase subunit b